MVNIVEYTDEKEQVIALLRELQEHLVAVDGEKVQILRDEYGKDYFDYLLNLVNDNDGKIFLAKTSDSVFGMIAGYVETKDAEDRISNRCPKRGVISDLVVSSPFRSKGIGAVLMSVMENYFSNIGCEFIAISVFAPNEGARSFYEKSGYVPRNIELYKRIREQGDSKC